AQAITDALAKQADAAKGPQGQQGGPSSSGEDQAKNFAAAADEVRLAINDMTDADGAIKKTQGSTNQTITLKPAVDSEGKALDHLQNALRLLQPPQQQKQDKQDKQEQQQQQQKDKKDKKEQQQPQGGAGQRARDDDAKRQRAKQNNQTDPVDK